MRKSMQIAIGLILALCIGGAAFAAYHSYREVVFYDVYDNPIGWQVITCGTTVTRGGETQDFSYAATLYNERCLPENGGIGAVGSCLAGAATEGAVLACLSSL